MSFILNLLAFLLIVFGFIFLGMFKEITLESLFKNVDKEPTEEQIKLFNKLKVNYSFYAMCSIILGFGIVIAKIFS